MLDCSELAYALSCVPWTSEFKDGQLPVVTGLCDHSCKHHLGHRKTEEFIKFVKVAPCILHSVIPKQQYDCFVLLYRICQFLFSMPLRVEGWKEEDVSILVGFLWLHAIKYEECYGIEHCSENLEYSLHLSSCI